MKKIMKKLFSRVFLISLAILIQVLWIVLVVWRLSFSYTYISMVVKVIAVVVALRISNKWSNPTLRLSWIFVVLAVPVLGLTLYLLFGRAGLTKRKRLEFEKVNKTFSSLLKENDNVNRQLHERNKSIAIQSDYIWSGAGFPAYTNTATKYFPTGESMFEEMLRDIKRAKNYIFMEYFIIDLGVMWDSILAVLEEKVKEGVDVRVIYDDVGCVTTLPSGYYKTLQKKGIKCARFNPFRPVISVVMNNRDHRKILVVDGYIGYTGGINIADEYINKIERFGYWKDTGIRLCGEAVWSLTIMFLEMWNSIKKSDLPGDYKQYIPTYNYDKPFNVDGYVQPYCDTPLDKEIVGENVYLNMITRAQKYVYIFTPYLVTDNELLSSLILASKSGIDVRIVTPGIPDKKYVFWMGQANFLKLIDAGIKIYQYTPGFLHAKCFVSDDEVATVGTFNMDYRSLYMHFECGVWMYRTEAIKHMKRDFLDTMEKSKLVTREYCQSIPWGIKTIKEILNIFSPLL